MLENVPQPLDHLSCMIVRPYMFGGLPDKGTNAVQFLVLLTIVVLLERVLIRTPSFLSVYHQVTCSCCSAWQWLDLVRTDESQHAHDKATYMGLHPITPLCPRFKMWSDNPAQSNQWRLREVEQNTCRI